MVQNINVLQLPINSSVKFHSHFKPINHSLQQSIKHSTHKTYNCLQFIKRQIDRYIQQIMADVEQIQHIITSLNKHQPQHQSYANLLSSANHDFNRLKKIKSTVKSIKAIITDDHLDQNTSLDSNAISDHLRRQHLFQLQQQTIDNYETIINNQTLQILKLKQHIQSLHQSDQPSIEISNAQMTQTIHHPHHKNQLCHIFTMFYNSNVTTDKQSSYYKKFRSLVKISIESLNMYLKILHILPNTDTQVVEDLANRVKTYSNSFIQQYDQHRNLYNSHFFKNFRDQLYKIYQKCVEISSNMLLPNF